MAQTHKLLGRAKPAGTTPATLYNPTGKKAIVTSLFVCNTAATADSFRIHLIPSGGSANVNNAIYYDCPIAANATLLVNGVPVVEDDDEIGIYCTGGNCTFTASGLEIS